MREADEANRLIQKRKQIRVSSEKDSAGYVRSLFGAGDYISANKPSPSPLYNAFFRATISMTKEIIPYHRLYEICDDGFSVEDIARLSHIPCRKVIFDKQFTKDLLGNYIVFDRETGEPGVLVQEGNKYYLVMEDKPAVRVTMATKKTLSDEAYLIYEPLPDRELRLRDVIRFTYKGTDIRDVRRFIIFGILSLALGIMVPYITQIFYDFILRVEDMKLLVQSMTMVLFYVLATYVFSSTSGLCLYRILSRGEIRLKSAMMDRVFRLPASIYNEYDSSDLTSRTIELAESMTEDMAGTMKAILGLLFSVGYLTMMFMYDKMVTWVCLGCLVVVTCILLIAGLRQKKRAILIKDAEIKSQTFLFHMINGITAIRTSGSERMAMNAYMRSYAKPLRNKMRSERTRGMSNTLRTVTATIVVMLIVFIADDAILSIGEYVVLTTLFGFISSAVFKALDQLMTFFSKKPVYDRARVIFGTAPDAYNSLLIPKPFVGRVNVEHLGFTYKNAEKPVFKDISFSIEPGEYIGIVGASGSGKSTIMKLLLGFEQVTEGKIYYDGYDFECLDKKELRRRMGVVLQNGNLIAGTIAENVSVTKPDATEEEIMSVLDRVGMTEDIERMPMGIRTILSEMSETISGGQRQRILIARAILAGPRILFMDEATSALDNASQKQVTDALAALDMTRVVIAHRLSTVKECDRIMVIADGGIAQMGTFDELMAEDGFFRDMAQRQTL